MRKISVYLSILLSIYINHQSIHQIYSPITYLSLYVCIMYYCRSFLYVCRCGFLYNNPLPIIFLWKVFSYSFWGRSALTLSGRRYIRSSYLALCRRARIFWPIFPHGRQLASLGWRLDVGGSMSPLKINISKIRLTHLFILDLISMLTKFWSSACSYIDQYIYTYVGI